MDLQTVINTVCKITLIDPERVLLKTRKREVITTRQLCIYFYKKYNPTLSSQTIANKFGMKQHGTVLNAVARVDDLTYTERVYKGIFSSIELAFKLQSLKKKVFISGPMLGFPNLNRAAFNDAEEKLKILGFEAINPHKIPLPEKNDIYTWEEYMRNNIRFLVDCDMVAVLDNWDESKRATIQVDLARRLGMKIFWAKNLHVLSEGDYAVGMSDPQDQFKQL